WKGPRRSEIHDIGTHAFVWEALKIWSQRPDATRLLEESVRVEGVRLHEWLTAFNPGGTFAPTAREWLKLWGLDLERFARDQKMRNAVSYEPTALDSVKSVDLIRG